MNLGVGLGLAVLLLAGSALIYIAMRTLAEAYAADRLRHDLDTLIAAATVVDGRLALLSDHLTLIYRQPYSGHYYRVSQDTATLRSRSLWDADFAVPALAAGQAWQGRVPGPAGQQLLVLAQAVSTSEGLRIVAVAEDIALLERSLNRLVLAIVGFVLASLAVLLWLQLRLIRRGLRPLLQLQDQLREMERGARQSLETGGVPREVLPLVQRLNQLFALLTAQLERSRKAAGNLAHALKTPLAVLTQTADDLADTAAGRQLREQLDAMRTAVDRELRRARLAGGGLPRRFDLHEAVEALLHTLTRIYRDKLLLVEDDCAPGAWFAGNREDFLELMGVLLDNAFKWARNRARIRVGGDKRQLLITIEDDGPGIAPELRSRLLTRGERLDEAQPGAGLGLAIAQDIVEQYQGRIELGTSALGGLAVSLQLPGGTA